jgi:hypothetical protein
MRRRPRRFPAWFASVWRLCTAELDDQRRDDARERREHDVGIDMSGSRL